jgi:hypothetical protein
MSSQKQEAKARDLSTELAPALDSEPVFERPSGFEQAPFAEQRIGPSRHAPTGAWADNRSSFGLEAEGGAGFLDPGSFALGRHRTDMMSSSGIAGGAMDTASADLSSDFSTGSSSGFSGGGGGGGGSGVSSGGDVA